ncbi:SRPBCC domain-containing protein [Myxococcota bacterium]|nr:SRPBCC domain-containing protein [Myxococcota bacterium]
MTQVKPCPHPQSQHTLHPEDRVVIVRRTIRAPAALLFTTFSRAEHLKRWFGPGSYPVTHAEVDFRVGGAFKMIMTGPDGVLGPPFGGTYLEIVPDERIVYENGFLAEGSERMIVTVTFTPRGEDTEVVVHTRFLTDQSYKLHVEMGFAMGTGMGLDQLAVYAPTLLP